jgi:hypothetical protein
MRRELANLKGIKIALWYSPDNSGKFFCFADASKEAQGVAIHVWSKDNKLNLLTASLVSAQSQG